MRDSGTRPPPVPSPPMSHDSTPARRRPLAIDLFSGAGGMSLGFEQAGFDVVAAVEYDPVHAATHEFNFPLTTVLCADVADVSTKALRDAARQGIEAHGHDASAWDGTPDVVFGGPPCQGFSSIGRRLVDDRRNRLVFHFFRLVSELRPHYFVMENVPGMARGGHASILRQLVNEFEEAGYRFPEGGHRVLDAALLGVPQQRRRLFLLGARDDQPLADYPTPTVNPVPKCGGDSPSPPPGARDRPIGPYRVGRHRRSTESQSLSAPTSQRRGTPLTGDGRSDGGDRQSVRAADARPPTPPRRPVAPAAARPRPTD